MNSTALLTSVAELERKWGWFLALGILQIVLGAIAIAFVPAATLGTVLVLGWLMILSGVLEGISAFQARRWEGVFLHLAGGALGVLLGLLVVTHPVAGAMAWTLLFASFMTVIGVFRLIGAIRLRYKSWGWAVFDGALTLALGIILSVGLPWSGMWFLGLTLGIALIVRGWSTVMFALAIRSIKQVLPLRRVA